MESRDKWGRPKKRRKITIGVNDGKIIKIDRK